MNNDYPILDGINPSWADVIIRVSAPGAPLLETRDIKSIATSGKLEIGTIRGASGGRVMSRTTGQSDYEASLTLYHAGYVKMLKGLRALAPKRGSQRAMGLVHFGLQLMFSVPGSAEIFERRLKGCRIAGFTGNSAEGVDANEVEVPLSVIQIVEVIDGEEYVLL